jgi:alkanesulfonate monooxygenase SsuD/methylene tetrahydromethanopterin reductase-like flavin-dependent oxidoreductase (luciferase family)
MGIPPEERAARMEETVRACQALWRDGLASFEGRWTSFTGMLAEPQPSTPGGVPVWFGGDGRSKPTARRVVELGAGWMSREAASYDEIAASIEHVNEVAAGAGRDASTLGFRTSIVPTPPGAIEGPTEQLIEKAVASAVRLAGAGVTHLSVPWNYYAFSIEDMATLLAAVRQA